jgi:histone deacetylase 1/2
MEAEFSALKANGTWNLVPPVSGVNLIDSRWIFKVKLHADGSIERYKARLVAKGYKQRYGLDYEETFSPVVKPAAVRLLLSLALSCGWHLWQLDIQNAFLNGFLDEQVYMRQPPGFADPDKPDHYCHLVKSLYGLNQAPRAWHARLSSVLGSLGFSPSVADTSLFSLHRPDVTIYLLIYVDDIIVISSTASAIPRLIDELRSEFSVKDLGVLHYFLGIEVHSPSTGSLIFRQRKYALELLARAGMLKCSPATTPMSSTERLCSADGDVLSPEEATQYRSIVGGL